MNRGQCDTWCCTFCAGSVARTRSRLRPIEIPGCTPFAMSRIIQPVARDIAADTGRSRCGIVRHRRCLPYPPCRAQRLRLIRGGAPGRARAHMFRWRPPLFRRRSPPHWRDLRETLRKTQRQTAARVLMAFSGRGALRRAHQRDDCSIVRASRSGAWGAPSRRPRPPSDLPLGARST